MLCLMVYSFNSNKVRFENRDGRVWVSLTDMAKASGKLLGNWTQLKSTIEFLTEFSGSIGIPIDQIIKSNESSGLNSERGKQLGHWNALKSTTEFLTEFESVIGIPITETIQGGC